MIPCERKEEEVHHGMEAGLGHMVQGDRLGRQEVHHDLGYHLRDNQVWHYAMRDELHYEPQQCEAHRGW